MGDGSFSCGDSDGKEHTGKEGIDVVVAIEGGTFCGEVYDVMGGSIIFWHDGVWAYEGDVSCDISEKRSISGSES